LDPAGGAYSAPPDPLADGEGDGCPLPKNPKNPSGFSLSSPSLREKNLPPQNKFGLTPLNLSPN